MDFFDEFIIVEEKSFSDFIDQSISSKIKSKMFSKFAALKFQIVDNFLFITDIGNTSAKMPLAQIIQWDKGREDFSSKILKMGGTEFFSISQLSSIAIRILKKRENTGQNPCSPLSPSDPRLLVNIDDSQIIVSAHLLMSVSPVINQMLSVEMGEEQQQSLTVNGLDINMEQFMEFLEYISPIAMHQPILPNPKNVLMLLKLAEFFQVDWLKSRCEMHLINCMEISLIDRFLLIDRYRLNNLKCFFMHLGAENYWPICFL